MEGSEKKKNDAEAFDLYERIKPTVQEYCDNWILVGHRAGGKGKIIIGTKNGKWGSLESVYDNIKQWKKDTVADT